MTLSTLSLAYQDWYHSRAKLRRLVQELEPLGLTGAQTEIVLENALMHALGRCGDVPTQALFEQLSLKDIQTGLAVGEHADHLDRLILQSLSTPLPHAAPTPGPIECSNAAITLGEFSVARHAAIDRALTHVQAHHGAETGLEMLLSSALKYASIYAKTRHIGPPQRVYDTFYEWGVRNEGFASPFNARLLGKPDAGFFSAFPSTDAPFGSRGSFFHNASPTDFSGAWCVDPPFLESTLRRAEDQVASWLKAPNPPAVLFIGPSSFVPRIEAHAHVKLICGEHWYEGLAGTLHPLPEDVSVYLYGELEGFDAEVIKRGYAAP